MKKSWRGMFVLAILVMLGAQSAGAEDLQRVIAIDVTGNRHIEKETILDRVRSKIGQPVDRATISRDVKRLYDSGFFSDVQVIGHRGADGVRLEYAVQEYPLIGNVELVGNHEVTSKDLKVRLKLKSGQVFSPLNERSDINTIRKGYVKKGYYQVDVDVEQKPRGEGIVDVVLHVHEGKVTRIKRIRFIGNKVFTDDDLHEVIGSRQSDAMTWLTDRDLFDKNRMDADSQMLLQYYMNRGYVDAKVESTLVSLSEDKSGFDLTFSLQEGVQYRIGKIELQGDVVPDEATLRKLVTLESGDIYSLSAMQKTIEALTERVGDEGYAFATVTPLFHRDIESRIVDISFDIEKGREVYVERIEVAGNAKTDDSVVRREMRQDEGARYSASKVRRSKERLKRIEYFDDVRVSLPKGSNSQMTKMRVEINEKKSGSLQFGVGYSQVEKLFFTAKIDEKNLLGKGYRASLDGTFGAKTQNYNVGFTDPYFMGEDVSASVGLYKSQTNTTQVQQNYNQANIGGNVGFGIPLTEQLTYSIGYNFNRTTLSNIPATASIVTQSQSGTHMTGEISNSLTYDSRDRVVAPHNGHIEQLTASYAGLGGNDHFYTANASSSVYFPFGKDEDFVLSPSLNVGTIRPQKGYQVPLYRRFSLGGVGSVRGFDSYGISVRDPVTKEALGGDNMATARVNLFFPIPYMQTAGFRGVAFADAGTTWGNVSATVGATTLNVTEPFSFAKIRASLGFGIEWTSPVGPVALVWGFPVRSQPGDVKRQFEFALGGQF
ncbi:MAG TPA: outer membrane protein assembly factor BamA [Mariprofundaceae bacterium]|nr:outer membrane protein assembly factor BamA [Mariprofundaceae bacterium]